MSASLPSAIAAPGKGALFAYGFMALPLAFAGLPVYLHAPDFYAATLGVPLASLGTVLLLLRLVDAVQDPLIGSLSDRFAHKRWLVLVLGCLLLGGGFFMVFTPPSAEGALGWFALSILLCTTGYSIVAINLQALGGLWIAAEHERTLIAGWREALGLIGLLLASIAPAVLDQGAGKEAAFSRLALLYLPLLALALVLLLRWLRHAPIARQAGGAGPAFRWKDVTADPWRRSFFAIYLANTFASAIPAVLVIFFIRDRLGAESLTGLFLLAYFLSGAASMLLWQAASRRMGKLQAWAASMALSVLTFIWAIFIGEGDVAAYTAVCLLSGLALGADLALPASILAGHIARSRSEGAASRLYAVMALFSKGALALATGLTLPALGLAGYQPGEPLTAQTAIALSIAYAAVPCLLKLGTMIWLWRQSELLSRDGAQGNGLAQAETWEQQGDRPA